MPSPCTLTVEIPSGGVAEIPDLTGELTATDNRTPRHLLIVEQDPPAGTLVGVGAYVITTSITDQSGNTTTCVNIFCVTAEPGAGPFLNTPQSFTATCQAGTIGTSKTAVIPAGTYSSDTSQSDADAKALAAAAAQANAALCCCPIGEECPECPDGLVLYDDCYPYEYGCFEYPNCPYGCYPYGFGFGEFPVFPSSAVDHWWKMEEPDATVRRDAIATIPADLATSIVGGGIDNTAGKVNLACEQTGGANLNHAGSTQILYANTGFTLFGWLKAGTASSSTILVDYDLKFGGSVDRIRLNITVATSGDMTFVMSENVSNDPVVPSIIVTGGVGQWIFVRMWHNGPSGTLRLQLNNGSIFESPTTWTPAVHTTADLFFYGNNSPRYFDEWGLIYRVLSPAEASFLYNGGNGRTWPFA